MSYPKYQSYKESGIEWLGAMPTHWVATPIKHLGRLKGGAGFPHDDQGTEGEDLQFHKVNALGKANSKGHLVDGENTISIETAKRLGAHIFPEKSLVFAKVGAALFLARICQLAAPACIDNNMMGLMVDQKKFEPSFIKFAMSLVNFDLIANPGAVPSLNEGQIGNFKLGVPGLIEQNLIAEFLNNETAKIDELSKAFEGLIATLKEKRQAVISHAVTKGLDPSVPMKNTGVEWLGQVPQHWEVKKIRTFAEILRGKFTHRPRNDPAFYDGEYPFIQTGDVTATKKYITDFTQTLNENGIAVSKQFPKGTLVMTIAANIGDVAVLDFPAYFPDSIVGLVPNNKSKLMFLFYLMKAMRQPLEQNATVSTQMNLNIEQIGTLFAACPPIEEQQLISDHLDTETEFIDKLTVEAEKAVELLKERRTALISAAVTGKIDVRDLLNINKEEKIKEAA